LLNPPSTTVKDNVFWRAGEPSQARLRKLEGKILGLKTGMQYGADIEHLNVKRK
tara:strand:+ start:110412 stop:110573 length:162 start_codon:yes stop_codon:yes gene_type:complete